MNAVPQSTDEKSKAKQSVMLLFRIGKLCETEVEKMVELPLTWNEFHSSDTLAEGEK